MRLGEDVTEMLRIATTHLCPTMSIIRMLEYAVALVAIIGGTGAFESYLQVSGVVSWKDKLFFTPHLRDKAQD